MKRHTTTLLAALVACGTALSAQAAIVNVDLTGFDDRGPTGNNLAGVIGDPTPTWNPVDDLTLHSGLLDEDGNATTLSFDLAATGAPAFGTGGGTGDFFYSYAFLTGSGNPGTADDGAFTIGGLDNSKTYNLYFYATWEHIDAGSEFSVDGGSTWKLSDGVPSESDAAFAEGSSYVVFSGVAPTSGEIAGLWRTTLAGESTAHRGMFNALQIEEVVVPAPAALPAGLALIALTATRRRRNA